MQPLSYNYFKIIRNALENTCKIIVKNKITVGFTREGEIEQIALISWVNEPNKLVKDTKKLFIHGTAHKHFMMFLLRIPGLRDVQSREDYYPALENDMSIEMMAESVNRFETVDTAMSRCFPFPPPGYERKQRPEDFEILKEEKRKEKKHKKEKKDKERKEGKEKREKDRSDDKHRVKKDRKGKHKDTKDKEKDRGKEKEKSSISEEATVSGKLEVNNGEKLPTKGGHNKDWSIFGNEANRPTQFRGQNGGRSIQNILHTQGIEESKFALELDRRIRDDEKASGSQLLERVSGTEKRDQDATVCVAVRDSSGVLAEDKGKNKDKRVDNRKMGVQGFSNEFGNTMVQNLAGMAKSKVEGTPRPAEVQNDRRLPSKEKSKAKGDNNRDDKQKDRDRDKKSHKTDKEKEREKKKEKSKGKSETKESMQDRSKDVDRSEVGSVTSYKSTHLLEGINGTAVSEVNSRKRKDLDSDGILHDSDVRHNKLQRLTPHQLTENGRKLESYRIHCISTLDKEGVPNNLPLENKDTKVNGIIEAQKLPSIKPKPSAVNMFGNQIVEASKKSPHPNSKYVNGVMDESMMEDQIAEASNRPPHPDTKYLSEVLAVPKMEWPDVDDQEWLFTQKEPPSNSKVSSAAVNEELHYLALQMNLVYWLGFSDYNTLGAMVVGWHFGVV
ncbi:splicing regulatory glutamine/lysine-rich protein 1-like [Forsythia ovata]|uniref:Splicing regulatory glutamine/lysine-rich protein 1-like n=1 Tax=Forsythia ovata TaxID=205694 RepID=A0ABD1PHI5_9LAMI